jgi:hypothetical protein
MLARRFKQQSRRSQSDKRSAFAPSAGHWLMKVCRCNGDVRRIGRCAQARRRGPSLTLQLCRRRPQAHFVDRTDRKSGTGRQSLARARNLIAAWRMMRERDTLGVSVMTRPVGRALTRDVAGAKRRGIATHSGPTLIKGMEAAIVRIRVVPSAPFRSFGRRPI